MSRSAIFNLVHLMAQRVRHYNGTPSVFKNRFDHLNKTDDNNNREQKN